MVSVTSDSLEIESSLVKNVMLARTAGTVLNGKLLIKCIDGAISVEAPAATAGETLMRLPVLCLLPVELFELSISDSEIVVVSHEAALSRNCVALMGALVELYNLTGKIARHRRTSPWSLAASRPELLAHLVQRLPDDLLLMFNEFQNSGDIDKLMLASFLHSRTFNYRKTENLPSCPVLMPIIDFMNHHLQGSPVQLWQNGQNDEYLTIAKSPAVRGAGDECFAFYGLNDRFDTWMSYGFIDNEAPFVRSVPMKIKLPCLATLQLANFVKIRDREDLPPQMRDLHVFVPERLYKKGDTVKLASLLFPPSHMPDALRRTLKFLIEELNPANSRLDQLVVHAEAQLIAENWSYYANLLGVLESLTGLDAQQHSIRSNFIRMCELQLRRIHDYAQIIEGPVPSAWAC